ncbi:PREDICTED: histamine N-methyltransferase-like [Branchiostoma belcheri]|uniref:Histamine N-methyltransferase-like n=1 Tax=Branchiostoma belcheri TaxID=7741 RepID=A0A6P4ZDU0_BRABE|nr:PREDICTED: histamine N-methyltransferase-like [Branchiostoma belcheri]
MYNCTALHCQTSETFFWFYHFKGEVDSAILRKILQRQSSVYNRVVEPSEEMIKGFKALVQHDTSLGAVKFDWRQQTAEEYFSRSDGTKFDLAHAIHVLYHVEDHHATLRNMWEQLAEGGHLLPFFLRTKEARGKLVP